MAKSLLWLALLAGPAATLVGLFYFVHSRLRLESQLLDHWWRIHLSEIELVKTWRKNVNDGSLAATSSIVGSMMSSAVPSIQRRAGQKPGDTINATSKTTHGAVAEIANAFADKTEVTRATDTSGAWATSAADVCYGNITLGFFRLSKVALKPISRLHQSRKMMIELRGVSGAVMVVCA